MQTFEKRKLGTWIDVVCQAKSRPSESRLANPTKTSTLTSIRPRKPFGIPNNLAFHQPSKADLLLSDQSVFETEQRLRRSQTCVRVQYQSHREQKEAGTLITLKKYYDA